MNKTTEKEIEPIYIEVLMGQNWRHEMNNAINDFTQFLREQNQGPVFIGQGFEDGSTTWCCCWVVYRLESIEKSFEQMLDDWWREKIDTAGWLKIRFTPESQLEEE